MNRTVRALGELVDSLGVEPYVNRGTVACASSPARLETGVFSAGALEIAAEKISRGDVRAVGVHVQGGRVPELWRFKSVITAGDETVGRVGVVQLGGFDWNADMDHLSAWGYQTMMSFADAGGVVHGRVADGAEFSQWERTRWKGFGVALRGNFYSHAAEQVVGPDWGLLLGPGHLRRLQWDASIESFDGVVMDPLDVDGRAFIGVRATAQYEASTPTREQAWADFLGPVMWNPMRPNGKPGRWDRSNGPTRSSFLLLGDPES